MQVLTEESNLVNIANSIRNKTGVERKYAPAEMAGAIAAIETGIGIGAMAGDCGISHYSEFNNITDGEIKNDDYRYTFIKPATGNIENIKIQAGESRQEKYASSNILDFEYNMDIFKRYDESKMTLSLYENGIKVTYDEDWNGQQVHCKLRIREEDLKRAKYFSCGIHSNNHYFAHLQFVVHYTDGSTISNSDADEYGGVYLTKTVDYIDYIISSGDTSSTSGNAAFFNPYITNLKIWLENRSYGKGFPIPSVYCPSDIHIENSNPIEIIDTQSGNLIDFTGVKTYYPYKIYEGNKSKVTFFPEGLPPENDINTNILSKFNLEWIGGSEDNYYLFISSLDLAYFDINLTDAIKIFDSDNYNAFIFKCKTDDASIKLDFQNTYKSLNNVEGNFCIIKYNDEINQDILDKKINELFSIGFDNLTKISTNIDLPSEFYGFYDINNNLVADYIDIDNNLIKRKYQKMILTAEQISGMDYTTSDNYVFLSFYNFPAPINSNSTSYIYSNIGYPVINNKDFNLNEYGLVLDKCYIIKSGSYAYIANPLWKRRNEQGTDITSEVVARAKEELKNAQFSIEFYYPLNNSYNNNIKEQYNPIGLEVSAYTPITLIKNRRYYESYDGYDGYAENIITGRYRDFFEIKKSTNKEYGIVKPDNKTIYINEKDELAMKGMNLGENFILNEDNTEIYNGNRNIPIQLKTITAKPNIINNDSNIRLFNDVKYSLSSTTKLFKEINTTIPEIFCFSKSPSVDEDSKEYIFEKDNKYYIKRKYYETYIYPNIYPDGTATGTISLPSYLKKGFEGSFKKEESICSYGWGATNDFFKVGETINEYANVEIGALGQFGSDAEYYTNLIDCPFVFDGYHILTINNIGFKYNTFNSLRFKNYNMNLSYNSNSCTIRINNENLNGLGINTPIKNNVSNTRELIQGCIFFTDNKNEDFDNVTLTISATINGVSWEEDILFTKNSDTYKIQPAQGPIENGVYPEFWFMYFDITDYLKSKGYQNCELLFNTYNIYSKIAYIHNEDNRKYDIYDSIERLIAYDLFTSKRCLLRGYKVNYSDPDYSKYNNDFYNPFYRSVVNNYFYLKINDTEVPINIPYFSFPSDGKLSLEISNKGPQEITGYYYYNGEVQEEFYHLNEKERYFSQNDKYGFIKSDNQTLDIKDGIGTVIDVKLEENINSDDNLRYEGTRNEKVKDIEIIGKQELESLSSSSSLQKVYPKFVKEGTKIKLYNSDKSKVSSCTIPFNLFGDNTLKPKENTFENTVGINTMLSTDDLLIESTGLISKPYDVPITYINGFCSAAPLTDSISQLMSNSYGAAIENGRLYIKTEAVEKHTVRYEDAKFTNDIIFTNSTKKFIIRPKTEGAYIFNVRSDYSRYKFDTILFYNYSRLSSFDVDFIYIENDEEIGRETKTFSSTSANDNLKLIYEYDSSTNKYIYYKGLCFSDIEDEITYSGYYLSRSKEYNPIYIEWAESYWFSNSPTAQFISECVSSNFATNYLTDSFGTYNVKGFPPSEAYIQAQKDRIAAVEPIIFIGNLVNKQTVQINESSYPDLFNLMTQDDCTIIDFELPDENSLVPTFKGISTMPSNVNNKFNSLEQRISDLEKIIHNLESTISNLGN